MGEQQVDLTVLVTAYRSAPSLPTLTERLVTVLNRLGRTYEIIFVDDASPDDTWRTLTGLEQQYPGRIYLIQLARNTGQHNALMCGFRHARGRLIVTIDDDLQCQPEEIPKLLDKLERDDLDLVYGNYIVKQHNLFRTIMSIPVGLFFRHVFQIPIPPTSFRVMRRELMEAITHYRGSFTVVDGLVCWGTGRIGGVKVEHSPRKHGRSTHTLSKLVLLAFNVFTNFSITPLRFVSGLGVVMFLVGLVGGLIGAYVYGPGDSSVILGALVTLSGIQLLSLGLMGEYLGRVHLNMNGRPQYVVRRTRGTAAGRPDQPSDSLSATDTSNWPGRGDAFVPLSPGPTDQWP